MSWHTYSTDSTKSPKRGKKQRSKEIDRLSVDFCVGNMFPVSKNKSLILKVLKNEEN